VEHRATGRALGETCWTPSLLSDKMDRVDEGTPKSGTEDSGVVPPVAVATLRRPAAEIVDDFTILYYQQPAYWAGTYWLGVHCVKSPLDLWIYQEIVHETRPDLIVETGTWLGGSALHFASLLDLIDNGRVVSIDLEPRKDEYPTHPRVAYWGGRSSVDPALLEDLRRETDASERVMVVLDSDHRKEHVLAELDAYAPLVTPGCYLVCEDTAINGHPIFAAHGPGPAEALAEWLPRHRDEWEVDPRREKFLMTFNPGGFLRSIRA
jgi:cephalosporin hydroxylase